MRNYTKDNTKPWMKEKKKNWKKKTFLTRILRGRNIEREGVIMYKTWKKHSQFIWCEAHRSHSYFIYHYCAKNDATTVVNFHINTVNRRKLLVSIAVFTISNQNVRSILTHDTMSTLCHENLVKYSTKSFQNRSCVRSTNDEFETAQIMLAKVTHENPKPMTILSSWRSFFSLFPSFSFAHFCSRNYRTSKRQHFYSQHKIIKHLMVQWKWIWYRHTFRLIAIDLECFLTPKGASFARSFAR